MDIEILRYNLNMVYDNLVKLKTINTELIEQYQKDYKDSLKNDTSFNTCLFLDNLDSIGYKLENRNKIRNVIETLVEVVFQAKRTTDEELAKELIRQSYKIVLATQAPKDILLTYTLHQAGFVIPEAHTGNLWKGRTSSEHLKVLIFKNIIRSYGQLTKDQILLLLPLSIKTEHSEETLDEFKLFIEHIVPILLENNENYEDTYKMMDEYIDELQPENTNSRKKNQIKMLLLKHTLDFNLLKKIKTPNNTTKI